MKKLIIFLALTLCLPPFSAFAKTIQTWSTVIPWFSITFEDSSKTGLLVDTDGSNCSFGIGKTPEGARAVKLSYTLKKGGYAGVWNYLNQPTGIFYEDALKFKAKSTIKNAVYRLAAKDEQNVLYYAYFKAPYPDWDEVTLPLSSFQQDPNSFLGTAGKAVTSIEQFNEEVTFKLGLYMSNMTQLSGGMGMGTTVANSDARKIKRQGVKDSVANVKRLAMAEVHCGPGRYTWGPAAPIDWAKVRIFCLSPMKTGSGEVLVGPIEAVKLPPPTSPTATPTVGSSLQFCISSGDGKDVGMVPVTHFSNNWAGLPCGSSKWIYTNAAALDPFPGVAFSDTRTFELPPGTNMQRSKFTLEYMVEDAVNIFINGKLAVTCVSRDSADQSCYNNCSEVALDGALFRAGSNVLQFNGWDNDSGGRSGRNTTNTGGLAFELCVDLTVESPTPTPVPTFTPMPTYTPMLPPTPIPVYHPLPVYVPRKAPALFPTFTPIPIPVYAPFTPLVYEYKPPPTPTPLAPAPRVPVITYPQIIVTVVPTKTPTPLPVIIRTPVPAQAAPAVPTPARAALPPLAQGQTFIFSNTSANIYVTFADGPGRYQVFVVDSAGYLLKAILDRKVVTQSDAWLEWDGRNARGYDMPPGQYYVVIYKGGQALKSISLIRVPAKP